MTITTYSSSLQKDLKRQKIKHIVENYFGFDFFVKNRERDFVFARQVYAYCLWKFAGMSHAAIGRELGFRDHSMSIYCRNMVIDLCKNDSAVRQQVIEIETLIEG